MLTGWDRPHLASSAPGLVGSPAASPGHHFGGGWRVVGGRDLPTEPTTTSGSRHRDCILPGSLTAEKEALWTPNCKTRDVGAGAKVVGNTSHEGDWCLLTVTPGEAHGLCRRTCFLRLPARVAWGDGGGGVLPAKRRPTMRRWHPPTVPLFPRFPHQEQQIQSQSSEADIQSGWRGQHG